MLFNSIEFFIFFPVVCIIYYLIPTQKIRNFFLLFSSYFFYMNWKPVYALLLLSSTVVTWLTAIGIDKAEAKYKKVYLIICVIINLSILFVFKYYNFAAETITLVLQKTGIAFPMPEFKLLLPVGISFYIFQALGYSIDVYRGNTIVERNFFTYALFVSFFPQLVAGPIERSVNLLPQFKQLKSFNYERTMEGVRMMIWGYFLKLVLADRCGIYVDAIFNNVAHHNGGSFWIASLLFPFQIYGDFAGYSLVAIGAARIMGFHLMDNFRRPYLSDTVTNFWRRWHISLSTWFKDYIYIPLGGNRVGKMRGYMNLLITFTISGLWHGANWTFVIWGILHGFILCAERACGIAKKQFRGWKKLMHWFMTFGVICLGWVFFRANNLSDSVAIFRGMFTNMGIPYLRLADWAAIAIAIAIMLFKECNEEFNWNIHISDSKSWLVRHLYIVCFICYIILFGVLNGDQFIYFQF